MDTVLGQQRISLHLKHFLFLFVFCFLFLTQSGDYEANVVIGGGIDCDENTDPCNGPLHPSTDYQFKYRAYTSLDDDSTFAESEYSQAISTGTTFAHCDG